MYHMIYTQHDTSKQIKRTKQEENKQKKEKLQRITIKHAKQRRQ